MGLFFLGLALGLLLAVWRWLCACRQKRQIRQLANEVDRVLHGNMLLEIDGFREGDVAVLQDEIYKMTVRLREQTERLSADKQELANNLADISHQIRTPLTSLNLMAARLAKEELPADERRKLVRDMRGLLGRMEWLIETLLKMSKLDAGSIRYEIREIRMAELIDAALEPLAVPMELRGISAERKGDTAVSFQADFDWTLEAVDNILKNCMEYSPEGTSLEISWEETPLYVRLNVRDFGPGIEPEDLPHLFERFYRGKHAGSGSFGIGLSLAQMIVMQENGIIRAENHPQGGSRFSVLFYKGTI